MSFAEQLTKLLITNPQKALQGEDTSFGADALKTARMITPFANLWYAKAITNHLILQQLQEMANPGYNDRVRDRAQRNSTQRAGGSRRYLRAAPQILERRWGIDGNNDEYCADIFWFVVVVVCGTAYFFTIIFALKKGWIGDTSSKVIYFITFVILAAVVYKLPLV